MGLNAMLYFSWFGSESILHNTKVLIVILYNSMRNNAFNAGLYSNRYGNSLDIMHDLFIDMVQIPRIPKFLT